MLEAVPGVDFSSSDRFVATATAQINAAPSDAQTLEQLLADAQQAMQVVQPTTDGHNFDTEADADANLLFSSLSAGVAQDPHAFAKVQDRVSNDGAALVGWQLAGGTGDYPQARECKDACIAAVVEVQSNADAQQYIAAHLSFSRAVLDTVKEEANALKPYVLDAGLVALGVALLVGAYLLRGERE